MTIRELFNYKEAVDIAVQPLEGKSTIEFRYSLPNEIGEIDCFNLDMFINFLLQKGFKTKEVSNIIDTVDLYSIYDIHNKSNNDISYMGKLIVDETDYPFIFTLKLIR